MTEHFDHLTTLIGGDFMKKVIFTALVVLIIGCVLGFEKCQYNGDPYIGKYECPKYRTILILSKDNKFTIIDNLYKEAFCINGKYSIKDNNIELIVDKDRVNNCEKAYFKGKVKGSRIELNGLHKNDTIVYFKK